MNRNLVISGVAAAALHAGVLFGVPRGAAPEKIDERCVIPISDLPSLPLLEEEPEMVVENSRDDSERAPAEKPLPQGADLPDPPRGGFEIESKLTPEILGSGIATIPAVDVIPGAWGRGIIDSRHLDNSPETRVQGPPIYPREARTAKLEGEVLVEFTVDEAGRVLDPRVVRSSDRVFEDATLRAVSKWRFEPGRRHGTIVRFRMAVPVVFSLSD